MSLGEFLSPGQLETVAGRPATNWHMLPEPAKEVYLLQLFLSKQTETSGVLTLLQGLNCKAIQSEQIHQEGGLTTGMPCPPLHRTGLAWLLYSSQTLSDFTGAKLGREPQGHFWNNGNLSSLLNF